MGPILPADSDQARCHHGNFEQFSTIEGLGMELDILKLVTEDPLVFRAALKVARMPE